MHVIQIEPHVFVCTNFHLHVSAYMELYYILQQSLTQLIIVER